MGNSYSQLTDDELGELDEKHREFISVCELCSPRACMESYRWVGSGCPPACRLALCKAFIAKALSLFFELFRRICTDRFELLNLLQNLALICAITSFHDNSSP